MMKLRTHYKVLAAVIAVSSITAATATAATTELGNVERASKLLGMEVRADNRKVGELDNLVVDLESGRVLYAVVDVGDNKVALPPGIFTRVGPSAARVSATRDQIENAPKFRKDMSDPSEINKASFVSDVFQHFGQNEWWQGGARPSDQGSFNNVHRVTDLRGADVKSVMNQDMGEIQNLGIDLPAGRVVYVLMSPDSSLDLGDALFPMPPNMFTKTSNEKTFSADITKDKLASAPRLNKDQWSKLSDQAWASKIYQHYGKNAYFTGGPAVLQPTGRESGTARPAEDQIIGRNRDRVTRAANNPWYRDWEDEWNRSSNK